MSLWLVRAGNRGQRESLALEKEVVVIGWNALPDLAGTGSREQLLALMQEHHPDQKPRTLTSWVGQVWSFLRLIQVGDLVALPLKQRSTIAVGRIRGEYQYRPEFPPDARHTRPVEWLREFARSQFDQDILYSLGAFLTVCRIRRNNAEARVQALLSGKKVVVPGPEAQDAGEEEAEPDAQATVPDLEEFSRDQIRAFLSRRFKGHDLSNLVAAILEAQGYTVRTSAAGPDDGVDIIAGRGPLGFDPPRLAVQVKSSESPSDVKVIRELQGTMKNFGADQGLFVSWGGYRSSVLREAARAWFEIRLWDADDVVRMIQTHYDQLPEELQAELPLKRIWTLVLSDEEPDGLALT